LRANCKQNQQHKRRPLVFASGAFAVVFGLLFAIKSVSLTAALVVALIIAVGGGAWLKLTK
jgi:hypothetical protein